MRPKSLILLLLALGCGLVASIGISQVMENRKGDSGPVGEMEKIFIALKDIKVNEPINEKNIKLEDWPKEKVPKDAVREISELDNQRAGGTILAGEPIRKQKFAQDKRIDEIPSGYRVVAVPADAVSATGYLLQPGDRVDVLVYVNRNAVSGVNQTGVKTILQDVRVFAVNEQWRPVENNKGEESIPAKTISLLVTQEQAQVVYLADAMGDIRLTLRSPKDDLVSDTPSTEAQDIFSSTERSDRNKEWAAGQETKPGVLDWLKKQQDPQAAPVQVAVPVEPDETFTMELFKGEERSQVDFTRKGKDGRWSSNGGGAFSGSGGASVDPNSAPDVPLPAPAGGAMRINSSDS